MRISEQVICKEFPCLDVQHECYIVPHVSINPEDISVVLISEAAPADISDYYYAVGDPHYQQTTVHAFNEAGVQVASLQEILELGVYLTTAVKCAKTGYGINAGTIKECSMLLEQELELFPNLEAFLLMGDVAIKALNYIAKRQGEPRVIPAGSTYKIRGGEFYYRAKRAFPSYTQTGPSYGIEKSKQRMIAEDIASALEVVREV